MRTKRRCSRGARGARYACLIAAALPFGVAWGDWEAVSDVEMGVEGNDNPRLGQRSDLQDPDAPPDEDHTAVRMFTDARVQLANVGPRGNVYLQPRARLDTYADEADDDLQRDDLYLDSNASYDWTRTSAGLRANLARESILSTELLEAEILDPDGVIVDPIDTESGRLVLLDEHRNRVLIAPYADFTVSERSDVTLEASHLDISYTGPEVSGRTDFTDTRLALGVARSIDDRTRAEARLIASNYEADLTQNETDTVGVEGTFRRTLNEAWSFFLSTGLQRSEFRFVDADGELVDNASTDYTLNIGFRKRTVQSTLNLDIQRLLTPNAVGFLTERNQLRVFYRHRMTERLTGGFAFRYTDTGVLDDPTGFERDYTRLDLDLEWAFTPTWSLNVGLGAIDQKFTGDREDGSATLFSMGVVYRGLSRQDAGGLPRRDAAP
ncbi:MAG: hypothetical protein JXB36_14230 [Gammaproteobacteria bacterium]|nr:hypothetical protein [Gammaproteobacteria bacterium]